MLEKITDKMRRMCSRREYCTHDIRKKLNVQLEGKSEDVQKVIDILLKERYVDDLRYASAYARDKSSISGWGPTKIRYMLSSKGISKDIIAQAIEEIDSPKAQLRLDKLMENKFRALKDDPQCRLKMLRFGLGRGYDYEEVACVIDKLISKRNEEV